MSLDVKKETAQNFDEYIQEKKEMYPKITITIYSVGMLIALGITSVCLYFGILVALNGGGFFIGIGVLIMLPSIGFFLGFIALVKNFRKYLKKNFRKESE